MEPPGNVLWMCVVCVLLVLAVAVVFGQTVRFEFINLDDNEYVYENPLVVGGLTTAGVSAAFTRFHASFWIPLVWVSYLVDYQFCGLQPWGYHLSNVLLHAVTAVLLFLALRRLTGALWSSAVVAALFALHPLRAESVAWVTERKDVLSGVFFMLTLLAYARYARQTFALRRYVAVTVFFALGLMAKPMLVTLPFVLLLLDYWPLARVAWGGSAAAVVPTGNKKSLAWLLLEKIPLFALSSAECVLTLMSVHEVFLQTSPLNWRLANVLLAYAAYLGMMVCPVRLAAIYLYAGADLPMWQIVVSAVVLVGISVAVIAAARRRPYLLVGWLWYLGMLVPVIQLWHWGLVVARADRFTYLPQIGVAIMIVWTVRDVCAGFRWRQWVGGVGAGLLIALLGTCAWRQTGYWCDSETLWRRTLACTSGNYVAYGSLGLALADRGNALLSRGQANLAIVQYRRALAIVPNDAKFHYNLGVALDDTGRPADAVVEYEQSLKLDPQNVHALNNIAWIRATHPDPGLRNGEQAVKLAQRATTLSRNDSFMLDTLAAAHAESGRFREAIEVAHRALDFANQQNRTALVEAVKGRLLLYESGAPYRESIPTTRSDSR